MQIRRLSQVRVDTDELRTLLVEEVIKRELIDGDEAKSSAALLKKMQRRLAAKRNGSDDHEEDEVEGLPEVEEVSAAHATTPVQAQAAVNKA